MTLLADRVMTPTQLARSLNLELSHVSRTLKDLESLSLIECKNPRLRKGRLYAMSDSGKKVMLRLHGIVADGGISK
ncbi:hypothetical protein MUP59_11295 [Candidatus Bathyarchaeota archaeon]|nr:hypothetical protein [Candidatus Bathyarchaeota archaeon]